ncbi:MAG: pentapeptide repeat-containing protein [Candidatus Babeliales bacterium]|jgi:hypothetical protein
MFKKILVTIFVSYFLSISAYDQADLDLVLNPKCRAVCGLDLSGANLSGQNLSYKNFISVDFSGAMLEGVDFTGCYFIDCFFVDAYFGFYVKIGEATFLKCNMSKILYTGTDFFVLCNGVDSLTQDTFRGISVEVSNYSEVVAHLPGSALCRRKHVAAEPKFMAAPSAFSGQDDFSDDSSLKFYDASCADGYVPDLDGLK